MKFLSPQYLWLLTIVPVVLLYVFFDERARKKRFAAFASETLWKSLAPEAVFGARFRKSLLLLASFAFLTLTLARPQWGTKEEVARMAGLDVVIALDVSNSMETEDIVPSRLKKAKHLVRGMVDHLAGNRVGLIAFAGSAYLACPLTTDLEYVLESLSIQSPRIISNQGTDIGLALETAYTALDRGAEQSDGHDKTSALPTRVVVLVTDGEDHEGGADELAAKLKTAGIKLFIFGVGTQRGGPVPLRDESGQLQGYKRDRKGEPVVSSFHPQDLLRLANEAGGRYWNASESEDELTDFLKDLGALGRGEFAEHRYLVYEERFQFPLALAILFLVLELTVAARRKRAGSGVALMVVLPALLLGSAPAKASPVDTYLENKKGIEAYDAGKFDEAKEHFGAAQAREPQKPELYYNQGLVELQSAEPSKDANKSEDKDKESEHLDAAIRSFSEAAQGGAVAGKPEIVGKSLFNLGTAFSKKGDNPNALRSYLGALETARQSGDKKLEDDARRNIQLLAQQPQQQKKQKKAQDQQKQDQQKQDQQKQDSKDQQKGDPKKDQGQQPKDAKDGGPDKNDKDKNDPEKKPDQPPHYSETQKYDNFKSKKLNRDDAERVFAELKSREQELQTQKKKQNARHDNDHEDW